MKIYLIIPVLFFIITSLVLSETSGNQITETELRLYHRPDLSQSPPSPPDSILPDRTLPSSPPVRATLPANGYLSVDVLLVIYTHFNLEIFGPDEIDVLLDQVTQAREFFARNSRCRFNVKIAAVEIIDRVQSLDEHWLVAPPGGYWYPFWEVDGINSVRNDLYNLGYVDNQFAAVFVFHAWEQTEPAYAAYGGGAYGVDVGFMGRTAYASVPLCWDPTENCWLFVHEFHHQLDDMWRASGRPEYPHADIPTDYDGVYDDGYSFNGWMLRDWPRDNWALMAPDWGSVLNFTDSDLDTLPDNDLFLAIDETRFGSSAVSADSDADGLDDLDELSAGYLKSSDPNSTDTDGDSRPDGADRYPIDAVVPYFLPGEFVIDGVIDGPLPKLLGSFGAGDQTDVWVKFFGQYSDTGLFLSFQITDDMVVTPWADPYWNDGIRLRIDAASDGYWAHGWDNYQIIISPSGSALDPLRRLEIIGPDGTVDTDIVPAVDLVSAYGFSGDGYVIELFLRTNTAAGFYISPSDSMRLQIDVCDFDTYPGWPHYESFSQFLTFGYTDDVDADGIIDPYDNCPDIYNPEQEDLDFDGTGDFCQYICGDADGEGIINILDIVFMINCKYKNGACPEPNWVGDVNNDDTSNILDIVYLINYKYKDGPEPGCF